MQHCHSFYYSSCYTLQNSRERIFCKFPNEEFYLLCGATKWRWQNHSCICFKSKIALLGGWLWCRNQEQHSFSGHCFYIQEINFDFHKFLNQLITGQVIHHFFLKIFQDDKNETGVLIGAVLGAVAVAIC